MSAAGWNGNALVRDLHRPNIETAFRKMAEDEMGIAWETAREMTFVKFSAALAAARRKKVA